MFSSLSWDDNGEIFCVFSSIAEGKSSFSLLILKQMLAEAPFRFTFLIAIDKQFSREMCYVLVLKLSTSGKSAERGFSPLTSF